MVVTYTEYVAKPGFKAPVAVSLDICLPQNILLFSIVFSEFYPLKGYRLLQHYKTIPAQNIGVVNSNLNGHFDFQKLVILQGKQS